MSAAEPLIRLRDVTVRHADGTVALSGLDLDIIAGRRLAILGESGSGKSTLALAIAGLLPPGAELSGRIGFPALGRPARLGRDIGMLFQDPAGSLDPVMRVGEQVAEAVVASRGTPAAEARALAIDWLERVRIPQAARAARRFPHQFSGGQKQRIALAAALAPEPRILIADEPTSALDSLVQREIMTMLDGLVTQQGLALVFVTHDIALASSLADDIAVLRRGRLVEAGRAATVLGNPSSEYVRALVSMHLSLDGPRAHRLPVFQEGGDTA